LRACISRATVIAQRTTTLLSIAKGADPVTENEFKLFKRAMGEQGSSHSSVADVIANAHKKNQLDAWYFYAVCALVVARGLSHPYSLSGCVWLALTSCVFGWLVIVCRGASGGMPVIGQKN
jgi:hypothetical protein